VQLPALKLQGARNKLTMEFPRHWFSGNPLTHADLIQEQGFLAERGFDLILSTGQNNPAQ
jgi:hypothetical protein